MPTPAHTPTLPPPHVPGLVTREHPSRRTTKCGALHPDSALFECGLRVGHTGAHIARRNLLRHELDTPLVWTAPPREWIRPDVWPSDAHRRAFAVWDKTCGRWPDAVCNDRHVFDVAGHKIRATCTRRPGHTGRHAHGDMGQVWAVWEKAPSAGLRSRLVICEDLHATTHAVCSLEAGHDGDHRAVGLNAGRVDATWSRPTADIQYRPSRSAR